MAEKIRLAVVSETTIGGVKKQILNLARHLNRNRFELTIVIPETRRIGHQTETPLTEDLADLPVKFVLLPLVRSISPIADLRGFLDLKQLLRPDQFDVVHAMAAKAGFLARFVAKQNRVGSCFYSPHGFAFRGAGGLKARFYKLLERLATGWCSALIVNSETERRTAIDSGIATEDKIFVVRNATAYTVAVTRSREQTRKEMGTPDESVVFLCLTRLVPYKGVDVLIDSFAEVVKQYPKVELWIGGEGEQRTDLEYLIERRLLTGKVRLLGFRPDGNDLLTACDCVALPSQFEGCPYSILEALAAEKPIIATAVEGTNELLTDSRHWRLVPWADKSALASAMIEFCANPFPGEDAAKLPVSWFDVPGQIRKLEEIYETHLLNVADRK